MFRPLITEICNSPNESLEIDPTKATPNDNIKTNLEKISKLTVRFVETILASSDQLPIEARAFLHSVKKGVEQIFPNSRIRVVAGFLFLRYLVPCLFSPEGFDILPNPPSITNRRTLVLIAKILQSLANGATLKEEFMLDFNNYVEQNIPKLEKFMDEISEVPSNSSASPLDTTKFNVKYKLRKLSLLVGFLHESNSLMQKEFDELKANPSKLEQFHKLKRILNTM